MVKKLRRLTGSASENQLAATVRESAHQIWLAGLGAFSKAQEEGNKVFEALVREGELIQARTRKVAGERVVGLTIKASGTWDRLEKVFEERVSRALRSLSVPSEDELKALSRRVDELAEQLHLLSDGERAKPDVKAVTRRRSTRKLAE